MTKGKIGLESEVLPGGVIGNTRDFGSLVQGSSPCRVIWGIFALFALSLVALWHDGLTAPMVIDGAINGELFLAYVEQILLPTLGEGDIVVMDNLSSHKVAGVKKSIK